MLWLLIVNSKVSCPPWIHRLVLVASKLPAPVYGAWRLQSLSYIYLKGYPHLGLKPNPPSCLHICLRLLNPNGVYLAIIPQPSLLPAHLVGACRLRFVTGRRPRVPLVFWLGESGEAGPLGFEPKTFGWWGLLEWNIEKVLNLWVYPTNWVQTQLLSKHIEISQIAWTKHTFPKMYSIIDQELKSRVSNSNIESNHWYFRTLEQ